MKKFFIVLLASFLVFYNVSASELITLEEGVNNFGTIIYNNNEDIFLMNKNNLEKININTKSRELIHSFDEIYNNESFEKKNNFLYLYYNKDNNKVLKYDLYTNEILSEITIDTSMLGENIQLSDIKVDNNGNMYFSYGLNSVASFDKDGNFIDKAKASSDSQRAIMVLSSIDFNNNRLYVHFPLLNDTDSAILEDAYIDIDNGKFTSDFKSDNWYRGLKYSDDGKYVLSNVNGVFKTNNDGLTYIINTPYARSVSATGTFTNDFIYIKGDRYYYRFNICKEKIDKTYTYDYKDGLTYKGYVVYNDNIYQLSYKKNGDVYNYYLVLFDSNDVGLNVLSEHKSLSHSKDDVINKYNNSLPKYNYKKNIYDVNPVYLKGKYVEGKLKQEVINDALNELNFYRWLYGINEVTINEQFMSRSQKGALIQKKNNQMSHTPSKPSDMSDDFYKEAFAGTYASIDYEGNVAYGHNVYNIAKGYIEDLNNIDKNNMVGHRDSMLNIHSNMISFGYVSPYNAASVYVTNEDLGNKEKWYSFPTAGYFPVNGISNKILWSVLLNSNMYFDSENIAIKLYDEDNNEYQVKEGYGIKSDELFFQLPSDFLSKISSGGTFRAGSSCKVRIEGLKDEIFNDYVIEYPIYFIDGITGLKDPVAADISIEKGNGNSVTVKINNFDNTYNYAIQKSTNNKKWSNLKNGQINGVFNVSGLVYGQKTYYRVVTTIGGKKVYSPSVNIKVYPDAVNNLKISKAGSNNIVISYDKAPYSGYEIQRSTKEASGFKKVTYLTKSSKTSYNNKKLKNGTTYYYRVRAYKTVKRKKIFGPWSNVVSATTGPTKPSKLTIKAINYNTLNINIKGVKTATSYEVSRSTKKNKGFITVGVTNELVYNDTVDTGTKYYYKVRACNATGVCSGWSKPFNKKTSLNKTTLNGISEVVVSVDEFGNETKIGKANLTLGSVEGASGYYIQRSTKKSKGFKNISEITDLNNLTFEDTGVKVGKTYYYKARAYRLVNGKKVYSGYTKVIKVTIK